MDGWVTIGAKLDTTQLEQEVKQVEKELKKVEREGQQLAKQKLKIQMEFENAEKIIDQYEHIEKLYEELHRDVASGDIDPFSQQYMDNLREIGNLKMSSFGNMSEPEMIAYVDDAYTKYAQLNDQLDQVDEKIQKNTESQQEFNAQLGEMNDEISGMEKSNATVEQMESSFGKIGNSIGGLIKKVIRWGLALLGIRTVLSLLSRSFSTLSQYNEDLANRVESMRLLLAVALEPVINWIVNLAEKLLQIVASIMSLLFHIDIYARASELSANKMAKGFGGASKSAKELKKQLAGFDEMNVLTEPTESSGGGGGGSGFNLKKPDWDNWKMPSWLQWIFDNWDLISGIVGAIAGALVALKLGLDPLLGAGIGLILAGIVNLVIDIIDFIKDPSWEKFKSLIDDFLIDIGMIIAGIGLLTGNWIPLVIGLIIMLAGVIIRYWDQIWGFLKQVGAEFKREAMVVWEFIKGIWNKFKEFHEAIFWGAVNYVLGVFEKLKNIFTNIWNFIKNIFNTANNFIASVIAGVINIFTGLWNSIINSAKWCWDKVKSVFNGITSFFSGIISKIIGFFSSIGQKVGDAVSGAFKGAINGAFKLVENVANTFVRGINNVLSLINAIPGVNIPKLKTVSLPRLAKGGIINQPGRGVMIGGAIAGESGREGVIPLTDSQQMALLGEAIGKYITINANITNTMNGRVISRELQKIQNANDFAFNS